MRRLVLSLLLAVSSAGAGLAVSPAEAASALAPTTSAAAGPAPVCAGDTCTVTFGFTGDARSWVVPRGVTAATLEVRGGRGADGYQVTGNEGSTATYAGAWNVFRLAGAGGGADGTGGKGGAGRYLKTRVKGLDPGETLVVRVGGGGQPGGHGGWNGGGDGGAGVPGVFNAGFAGAGGGATDIRRLGDASTDRILVAGGGGGGAAPGHGKSGATDYWSNGGSGGPSNVSGQDGQGWAVGGFFDSIAYHLGAGGGGLPDGTGGAGGTWGHDITLTDGFQGGSGQRSGQGGNGAPQSTLFGSGGGGGGGLPGGGGGGSGQKSQVDIVAGGGGGAGGGSYVDPDMIQYINGTASADSYGPQGNGWAQIRYQRPVLTVTGAVPAGGVTYGDGTLPEVHYSGFLGADGPQDLTKAPTCAYQWTSATITCGGGEDDTYYLKYVSSPFSFTPATLTVSMPDLKQVWGDLVSLPLVPTITGYVAGDTFDSVFGSGGGIALPTCSYGTVTGAGTYPSTCSLPTLDLYTYRKDLGSLTVTPRPITITAPSPSISFGDPVPTLEPTFDGFNAVTGSTVDTPPTCSVIDYTGAVGSYTTRCSGAADPDFTFHYVDGALSVAQAQATVTAPSPTITWGDPVPDLEPTYSGLPDGTDPVTPATCTLTGPITGAGSYPVVCSGAADPDHAFDYVDGTLTVRPAPVTVTASDEDYAPGAPVRTPAPSYDGLIDDALPATAPTCTVDVALGTTECAGAADPNYVFSYVSGTLTVLEALAVPGQDLGSVVVGTSLAHQLIHTGGGDFPVSWSLVPGQTLPAGLALGPDGVISGTPAQVGDYRFRVQVAFVQPASPPAAEAQQARREAATRSVGTAIGVVHLQVVPAPVVSPPLAPGGGTTSGTPAGSGTVLPNTGSPVTPWSLALAVALIGIGGFLVARSRPGRRRTS